MKDKVVVITGASQGLGRELALQIAKLGASVALVARTQQLLASLKDEINTSGGVAEYFVCDVRDFNQVNQTVDKIIEKFGHIDIFINNAGVWVSDQLETGHPEKTVNLFMVNSVGPIFFGQKIIPLFNQQGSGHFIFINSIAGLDNPENKDWLTYTASKWALTGYAKGLASKFNDTNIKVTSIHPGPIDSKMPDNAGDDWGKDHSFMMTTAEVANSIIHAITAPGTINVGTIELKKTNWNQ